MDKKLSLAGRAMRRARHSLGLLRSQIQTIRMARAAAAAGVDASQRPVVFFAASTRTHSLSLNAGFSLVASWALRLAGVPVIHFVCRSGMSRCVIGTNREDVHRPIDCRACLRLSRLNTTAAKAHWFDFQRDPKLAEALAALGLAELMRCSQPLPAAWGLDEVDIPLGALVLPAIRWVLRRHDLVDDESTRFLYREFLLSAWNIAAEFNGLLARTAPQAVVLFNGQFYPEATARWIAQRRGVRAVTHEVGLQPFSAFFTDGEATAYPIHIPDSFVLDEAQNARLDGYLERRFQGRFSMAGIRFWPEMKGLDKAFMTKAADFRQIVPVFTNVVFDTSQPHSNVVFPDMFAWLDLVLEIARAHPETLFVLRAHPDESRIGKESRQSVRQWVEARRVGELANVLFVDSTEGFSSYELIQRSKFVMVYNSTIGLEASILGAAVLCGGRARFTQYPTVFFPQTPAAYRRQAEAFLKARQVEVPPDFVDNARRFLYYQLYRVSLPFEAYFQSSVIKAGFVYLRLFSRASLLAQRNPTVRALLDGILGGRRFTLEEETASPRT
jgi:hypothetical protein